MQLLEKKITCLLYHHLIYNNSIILYDTKMQLNEKKLLIKARFWCLARSNVPKACLNKNYNNFIKPKHEYYMLTFSLALPVFKFW